jgi:hypothetical protein
MLYKDKYDLPMSINDEMDSAVRAGIMSICGEFNQDISQYVLLSGKGVRHPYTEPSNNPNNFTRDQMIPLVAGLYAQQKYDVIKKLFYSRLKSFFFMQNVERDYSGSTKYPIYFGKKKDQTLS